MKFTDHFIATGIGSVPHQDAAEAVRFIREQFRGAPFWPQLPNRTSTEGMVVQYSEGFPSLKEVQRDRGTRLEVSPDLTIEIERFYQRVESQDWGAFQITKDYAPGLWALADSVRRSPQGIKYLKGQVTGPVTFGLGVVDEDGKPIFYDPSWRDIVTKQLASKARWMELTFKGLLPEAGTIIFFDEPALSSFGSAFSGLNREDVVTAINECVQAVKGLRGVHCCGNTDWSLLLDAEIDVLSFDAFGYFDNLFLYVEKLHTFLQKGGILAWGIVPTSTEVLTIDPRTLADRVRKAMADLERKGINPALLNRGIITPSCGVASLPVPVAEKVCRITAEVSERLRGG